MKWVLIGLLALAAAVLCLRVGVRLSLENGTLEEAWGCGTAAVVSPIGELSYKGEVFTVNEGKIGEVTQKLYDTLTGIQWGKIEDKFGWICPLD